MPFTSIHRSFSNLSKPGVKFGIHELSENQAADLGSATFDRFKKPIGVKLVEIRTEVLVTVILKLAQVLQNETRGTNRRLRDEINMILFGEIRHNT